MDNLIVVRGGGDLATGTIYKLIQCGFPVLILETAYPSAIRRQVAFSEAVYEGKQCVENITCYRAENIKQALFWLEEGKLSLLVDANGDCLSHCKPLAVVDAILAKKNLGTYRDMAPITVALGPGFAAGVDVDAVIETKRGHRLGRVLYQGTAAPNTGVPGVIAGVSKERVIHASAAGILHNTSSVGDVVEKGQEIAWIETETGERVSVNATISGLLRGLIRDAYPVTVGFKIADIDPRLSEYENCFTISDKARCIAGGVVEAILHLKQKKEEKPHDLR
jgi:xanthine dehydrogenase accessory factor